MVHEKRVSRCRVAVIGVVFSFGLSFFYLAWQTNHDLSIGLERYDEGTAHPRSSDQSVDELPDLLETLVSVSLPGDALYHQTARVLTREGHEPERALWWHVKGYLYTQILSVRQSRGESLRVYLKHAYLGEENGESIHGVSQAAKAVFSKGVRDLNGVETALLVSRVSGATYDFRKHPENAVRRARWVLSEAVKDGKLEESHRSRIEQGLAMVLRRNP